MLFQKQVDRAMKLSEERAGKKKNNNGQEHIRVTEEGYHHKQWQEEQGFSDVMEKGDLAAMIISALMIFLPAGLIVILLMCFIGMFPLFF